MPEITAISPLVFTFAPSASTAFMVALISSDSDSLLICDVPFARAAAITALWATLFEPGTETIPDRPPGISFIVLI